MRLLSLPRARSRKLLLLIVMLCIGVALPAFLADAGSTVRAQAEVPSPAPSQSLRAADFGIRADSDDNTDALRKALAACHGPASPRLVFEPGIYRFKTSSFGKDQTLAEVQGISDLTVEGNGAQFLFCGDVRTVTGLRFTQCKNVRISKLTVDCETLPFAQGTIMSFEDSRKLVIEVDPKFPLQPGMPIESIVDCDPQTGLMLANIDLYRSAIQSVEKSEDGRRLTVNVQLTVDATNPDRAAEMKALQIVLPGQKALIRQATYGSFMFTFVRSSGVTLEDVTVHCFAGMAVHAQESADVTLRRFVAAPPKDSGRLLSITKDAVHLTHVSGSVLVEDCRFDAVGDDGINVYSKYRTVKTVTGERGLEMIFPLKGWRGPLPVAGETLTFWDTATMNPKGKAEVETAVWDPAAGVFRITFRMSLPAGLAPGDYVSSTKYLASLTVRRSEFRGMLARAIVFSTCNVLVEDCRITGTSYSGILFTAGLRHGGQGPAPRDVIIRNNEFSGTGGAAIYGYVFAKSPGNTAMANIRIEGNKITADTRLDERRLKTRRPDWLHWSAGICVLHATGVQISGNTLSGYPTAVYLENIANPTVTNNTAIAPSSSPSPLCILNRSSGDVVATPNANISIERDQKSCKPDLIYIGILR